MPGRLVSTDPSIARQVERQMRNWELARSQRPSEKPKSRRWREVQDFITVSRQVGADGLRVARAVGQRLAWPVFDREILEAMAGDDTVRRQIYESMDGRDLGWWEETLRSLFQSEFVRNDYFRRLSQTILSLARQSPCVLVGRGADLILPADTGFRVRLVAPLTARLSRVADRHCLTATEAREFINRTESQRGRFLRNHFGVTADDPTRFDITLSLGRYTCAEATGLIIRARSTAPVESLP